MKFTCIVDKYYCGNCPCWDETHTENGDGCKNCNWCKKFIPSGKKGSPSSGREKAFCQCPADHPQAKQHWQNQMGFSVMPDSFIPRDIVRIPITKVSDPSQPEKIRLMKKAMIMGAIWGIAVLYLLALIAGNTMQ